MSSDDTKFELMPISPVIRFGLAFIVLMLAIMPAIELGLNGGKISPGLMVAFAGWGIAGVALAVKLASLKAWRVKVAKDFPATKMYAGSTPRVSPQWEKKVNALADRWWVRYPSGVLLFILGSHLAGYMMNQAADMKGANKLLGWGWVCLLFFWGAACMKELFIGLFLALLFGGAAYLVAGVTAGLPVSTAIILGALIIASSNKKS